MSEEYGVRSIGRVESELHTHEAAPRQGDQGAPEAWVVFDDAVAEAWRDLRVGDQVTLLTFLDRADRTTLVTRPGSNPDAPLTGVFSTRSPDRPNPIGLHDVEVLERRDDRIRVSGLEALDGTPVLDVKSVYSALRRN